MPFLTKNIEFGRPLRLTSWRKIAIGTWRTAGDPSVYGIVDLDVAPALAYIEKLRGQTGLRITLSHFTGRAVAEVMKRHPDLNCVLRWGRLYPRKTVDMFFQVATDPEGKDLSGLTVQRADQKTIPEIAREMDERVKKIRAHQDPSFKKMKKNMGLMPGMLVGKLLDIAGFIMYTLNLWSPLLGSPRDPFGSAMITNIGSLGLDTAFAPLVPYSRVPVLLAIGEARDRPAVKDGQLVVQKQIRICVTVDHRLIDGMHASHMARTLAKIFANPEAELS